MSVKPMPKAKFVKIIRKRFNLTPSLNSLQTNLTAQNLREGYIFSLGLFKGVSEMAAEPVREDDFAVFIIDSSVEFIANNIRDGF